MNSPVDVREKPRHLAEIHAGPRWLWQALVGVLLEHHWTVESTGKVVAPLSKLEDLPSWANADMVAEALLAGTMPPRDVARLRERRHLALEVMALQHQHDVLAQSGMPPRISLVDRCFWVL